MARTPFQLSPPFPLGERQGRGSTRLSPHLNPLQRGGSKTAIDVSKRSARPLIGERFRVTNLLHLGDDQFELLVFRIEVRRDAHAGVRAIIDDELPAN